MRALQYQVDGVILTSAQISTRMTSICHERGIPIVLFNRYIPGSDASCVRCDNVGGGRLVAEAFLAAGARSFAMITGDPKGHHEPGPRSRLHRAAARGRRAAHCNRGGRGAVVL